MRVFKEVLAGVLMERSERSQGMLVVTYRWQNDVLQSTR